MGSVIVSPYSIIILLLIAIASFGGAVVFFKMIIHCYKSYNKKWYRVINPLHVISYTAVLGAFTAKTAIVKALPFAADYMVFIKAAALILAIISILDRVIKNHNQVGIGTNIGCLISELAVTLLLLVLIYGVFLLAALFAGILLAFGIASSGNNNNEGWQYYYLVCYSTGIRDYVYGVNGNTDCLFSVHGSAKYTRHGNVFFSNEDDGTYQLE